MEYILTPKDKGCFLCAMYKKKEDQKHLILKRGKTCAIVMNRYPYTPGHLMVAPYRHVDSLSLMTAKEQAEMMELTDLAVEILKKEIKPHGFNLGINLGAVAGAGLKDHIHMHVVPRWSGDTNFITVLDDIRIIPEALNDSWLALRRHFEEKTPRLAKALRKRLK